MHLRRSLLLAIVVLAFIAPASIAPAAQAAVPKDFIGITSEDVFAGGPGYRAAALSAQRSLGIGLIRQTFHWREIERSPGKYDLSRYDAYVAAAARHGVRILPILFNPPSFHAPSRGNATCPPRSNATMAAFAQVLFRRYGANGTLWQQNPQLPKVKIRSAQIWNEPNLGAYWCGRPNARRYVAMLKTVGGAIKRVDRRAEIVTAGLPPSLLRSAVPLKRYLRALYRARAKRYFDTLAINTYAKNQRELRTLLRSMRSLMNRRGDRRARIWITEMGWGDRGPRHRFIVGASRQRSLVSSSLSYIRRNRRKLRLRGFVYFSWRDAPPYPPHFRDLWGLHTGLLTMDGSPKRAFYAFKSGVRRLR